eukprot:Em0003g843a
METVASRLPLSDKNSGIPQKTSRLPPPKAIVKRPHDEVDESVNKENESQGKKAKIAPSVDTSASTISCATISTKPKPALAAKAPKSRLVTPVVGTKSSKPVAAKAVVPTTKPGIRGAGDAGAKKVAGKGTQKEVLEERTQTLEKELASYRQRCNDLSRETEALKLSDLQHQNMVKSLEEVWEKELSSYRQRCSDLSCEAETLKFTTAHNQKLIKSLEEAKVQAALQVKNLEGELVCSRQKVSELVQETEGLKMTNEAMKKLNEQTCESLAGARDEVAALKAVVSQMTEAAAVLHGQLDATKMALDKMTADSVEKAGQIAALREELRGVPGEGNIRVFCRVRPLLNMEQATPTEGAPLCQGRSRGVFRTTLSLIRSLDHPVHKRKYLRTFLNLFKVPWMASMFCIFAYGQTGSGKTFTMEGHEDGDYSQRGMIARAVEQVFACSSQLVDKGWHYRLEASFLEIYNETLRDLLAPPSSSSNQDSKLEIRMDPAKSNEVYVTNLTTVEVTSETQVADLLHKAAKARAVAATLCNERSSRSHSLFRLKISGQNSKTGEECEGEGTMWCDLAARWEPLLTLIDLAGSERLTNSGSDGDRLKETKSINKSLITLAMSSWLWPTSLMFVTYLPTWSICAGNLVFTRFATKVGDFGFTREASYLVSHIQKCPVKWMPPEMLQDGISTEKSDVWAYGVTCWEVFSLGATPYPGVANHEMLELLFHGLRLKIPTLCPENMFMLMKCCWSSDSARRPSFLELVTQLQEIIAKFT